jgi:hypothetical protein
LELILVAQFIVATRGRKVDCLARVLMKWTCPYAERLVAYLLAADNFIGPLLSRLRGTQQPVVRPRHAFSAPPSHLLARL